MRARSHSLERLARVCLAALLATSAARAEARAVIRAPELTACAERAQVVALAAAVIGEVTAPAPERDQVPGAPGAHGVVADAPTSIATEPSQARDGAHGPPPPPLPTAHIDEASRKALERGLAFLAAQQALDPEGAFALRFSGDSEPASASPREPGRGDAAPLAVAALGALAFMAGGDTPERGEHGRELGSVIDYLVAHTELDPKSERRGYVEKKGDALSRMHGHGFATLALAQAYSMSPHSPRGARIERALHAAIERIEASQGVEGGWYYEPTKSLQHEGSITICMVQALRAAHNAGFKVDATTIARAVDYVSRSQNKDGSFRYALGDPESTIALTAAAIATLNATGTYEGTRLDEAYAWLFRALAARESAHSFDRNPLSAGAPASNAAREQRTYCYFYERLYLSQALWQNADRRVFDEWAAKERARVLTQQHSDGSWRDERFGDTYATAMNCLFLALPEGMLPIFQR